MLILLPTILLLGLAAALGAVRFFRPRSRFLWLGAVGAVLGTWLVVLIWHFELPLSLNFTGWGATVALPAGLQFSVDSLSWVTAWSLTSMLLAGVDKVHRDAILGHSLKGMDARYIVVSDASLTRAMDQYTKWFDREVVSASVDQNVDQNVSNR